MVYLITIELPDKLAQMWVDENEGYKENDDDHETLKGCIEKVVWDTLRGAPTTTLNKIKVETWKPTKLTDEGAGVTR